MTDAVPAERRVAVTWDDPAELARAGRGMPGLEFLRAIARGDLPAPPAARLLGLRLEEVEDGRVVFAFDPGEQHYNPLGGVHGGISATALDSAMGCAVHSTLPQGTGYTTLEIKVNFVRAPTAATGALRAEARVVHRGNRVATAEGRLVDAQGRLYAHATTTCLVLAHEAPRAG